MPPEENEISAETTLLSGLMEIDSEQGERTKEAENRLWRSLMSFYLSQNFFVSFSEVEEVFWGRKFQMLPQVPLSDLRNTLKQMTMVGNSSYRSQVCEILFSVN